MRSPTHRKSKLKYEKYKRFWHNKGITALAFDPSGTYLASAGLDARLHIWSYRTSLQDPPYTIEGSVGFVSLLWVAEGLLLAGMEDGVLIVVGFDEQSIRATGFKIHNFPIECLDLQGDHLVTGAHSEVATWSLVPSSPRGEMVYDGCQLKQKICNPPVIAVNRHMPIIVTSVSWLLTPEPDIFMVSYVYHGIVLWNASSGARLRNIPLQTSVGFASLSPDHKYLVIDNLATGFDSYELLSHTPQSLPFDGAPTGSRQRMPIIFGHGGNAVIGGSLSGNIYIWDVERAQVIHSLPKEDGISMSLASCHIPLTDEFFVANGSGQTHDGAYIQIYKTRPVRSLHGGSLSRSKSRSQRLQLVLLILFTILLVFVFTQILPIISAFVIPFPHL